MPLRKRTVLPIPLTGIVGPVFPIANSVVGAAEIFEKTDGFKVEPGKRRALMLAVASNGREAL